MVLKLTTHQKICLCIKMTQKFFLYCLKKKLKLSKELNYFGLYPHGATLRYACKSYKPKGIGPLC